VKLRTTPDAPGCCRPSNDPFVIKSLGGVIGSLLLPLLGPLFVPAILDHDLPIDRLTFFTGFEAVGPGCLIPAMLGQDFRIQFSTSFLPVWLGLHQLNPGPFPEALRPRVSTIWIVWDHQVRTKGFHLPPGPAAIAKLIE
jgi:hypothetical protein